MKKYSIFTHRANSKPGRVVIALLLLLITATISCKKFLEIPLPQNRLVNASVFSDDNTATSAIVGIYSDMMQTFKFISFDASLFPGLMADEYNFPSKTTATWVQFQNNQITTDNADVNTCWSQGYSYIYDANAAIDGLQKSTGVTPAIKTELVGEAKFIRALNYFYLVNLFGDVPLALTDDYQTNAALPRTSTELVYKQIIQDLQDAQKALPVNYLTAQRARPNMWTATALLARVYLYTKDWKDAGIQAASVINSGTYTLSDVSSVFLNTSNETIWQLAPVNPLYNTVLAARIVPRNFTSVPLIPLTDDLVNAFEPNDLRFTNWVATSVAKGVTYHAFYKYKITSGSPQNEDFIVFRLAEMYLIRAEAELNQNDPADAISDIDQIRTRAGLPALSATLTSDQIAAALEHERRIELYGEWGHRWFDLKRNNRLDAVMGAFKPATWKSTSALWPIPITQINANAKLTQNPGY